MIIGSGVDVIEIARIEAALSRRGERLARRVFTEREIADCLGFRRPAPHFALRFAAKEAAMKALGTGWARGVRWLDIEMVAGDPDGRGPVLALRGRAAALAGERGASRPHLALARSRSHALAVVLLEVDAS